MGERGDFYIVEDGKLGSKLKNESVSEILEDVNKVRLVIKIKGG